MVLLLACTERRIEAPRARVRDDSNQRSNLVPISKRQLQLPSCSFCPRGRNFCPERQVPARTAKNDLESSVDRQRPSGLEDGLRLGLGHPTPIPTSKGYACSGSDFPRLASSLFTPFWSASPEPGPITATPTHNWRYSSELQLGRRISRSPPTSDSQPFESNHDSTDSVKAIIAPVAFIKNHPVDAPMLYPFQPSSH